MQTEFCPNCGRRGDPQSDGLIYCEHCDDTFKVSKQEKKVVNSGRMESLECRVSQLEGTASPAPAGQPEHTPTPAAPEPSRDDVGMDDL